MFELNVFFIFAYICSQDFSDQVLTVEPTAECFCFQLLFSASVFICFRHPLTVTSLDGLEVLSFHHSSFIARRVVKYVDAVSNCRFLHCLLSSVSERFTCQS